MRILKLQTVLTDGGQIGLKKELSVNRPDIDVHLNIPEKVYMFARVFLHMQEMSEEYVYMLCLNGNQRMTSLFEVSHGTVGYACVSPREIFQKALLANAVGIVLIHNHPSGIDTPSDDDLLITKTLADAGKLIGIPVLDHIIVGGYSYYSMKENEIIKEQ